ncbi:hypothetical protein A1O1_08929 [Capronia coronata CBS 617.96]|uniref:Uncharacterized protein n=1 Tax=Capronia coronata CBS 617.96 TaxID=1182541 RepID=W9XEA9_9EURO|nr:uncharacterized protein A1O1_08929 [Capronia coronata CBS 617.96]EXJ78528.1 hypothetical protein A1O1_08929 [Capronia coronata CBS 617.96]
MASSTTLREAPRDLSEIAKQEEALMLPHFTADDALEIGLAIRNRLRTLSQLSAVVNITLANSNNLLFHAVSRPGIQPDNDIWVARKRKTVQRWGVSSWFMHNKMQGDEAAFKTRYALGETAGEYAIHGGGMPVRVKGVEGIVGVIVVSGLKSWEDHQVIVDALEEFLEKDGQKPE